MVVVVVVVVVVAAARGACGRGVEICGFGMTSDSTLNTY